MQRMRCAQRLRLRDHLGVAAERQPGRQPNLQTGQARLGQPLRLRREQAAVSELAVRLPPPQRERLNQIPLGLRSRTLVQCPAGPTYQAHEHVRVDRVTINRQPVAPTDSTDHISVKVTRCECRPQPGHIHLHRLHRAMRRNTLPQRLRQGLHRDDLTKVKHQDRQQPALLRPARRPHPVSTADLQRTQHPQLHAPILHRGESAGSHLATLHRRQPRRS